MIKTLTLAATALAMIGGAVLPATAADAHRYRRAPHSDRYYRGYNDGARAEYQASKCRRSGTTGTIVGAVAGGLLGRTIDNPGRPHAGHADRRCGRRAGGPRDRAVGPSGLLPLNSLGRAGLYLPHPAPVFSRSVSRTERRSPHRRSAFLLISHPPTRRFRNIVHT